LGSTAKLGESAMINFIGSVPGINKLAAVADCHVHDYNKAFKDGRKVGHATVRSVDADTMRRQLGKVKALIAADN
ncbi:MAG: 5-(carboxyamino)imidazole ribonucleotide synthase, partial [Pseudohongiella sp.]